MKFTTHDNGGRPFRVHIHKKKKTALIEGLAYDWDGNETQAKPLFEIAFLQVFVGKSPLNSMTAYSGGHGKEFDGNSILFELSPKHYLFVGGRIFEFTTSHRIVQYVSPVGPSDVPYPFAVDDAGNRYLMIEDVFFSTSAEEPYDAYYNDPEITKHRLTFWTASNKKILIKYSPYFDPEQRLKKGKPLFVKNKQGDLVQVTGKQMLRQLTSLGKKLGYSKLENVNEWAPRESVICER